MDIQVSDPHNRLGPMTYLLRTRTSLWPYADAARSAHGEIEVRRRFNDFTQLRAELVAKAQSADGASPRAAALAGALSLPPLPGKVLFASAVRGAAADPRARAPRRGMLRARCALRDTRLCLAFGCD